MLGPLGTASRDGEHQSGVIPPMTRGHTLLTDRHVLPQALAMAGDHLYPLLQGQVTAVGNTMRAGARVKSETDQEDGMGERPVEANDCVRSAVSP